MTETAPPPELPIDGAPVDPAAPVPPPPHSPAVDVAAEEAAQREGFVNAQAKADANEAAKLPKPKKAAKPAKAKPVQKFVEQEDARQLLDDAFASGLAPEGYVAFGDATGFIAGLPVAGPFPLLRVKGRISVNADVTPRTGKLTGNVVISHAFLLSGPDDKVPQLLVELGSAVRLSPNEQMLLKTGTLSF